VTGRLRTLAGIALGAVALAVASPVAGPVGAQRPDTLAAATAAGAVADTAARDSAGRGGRLGPLAPGAVPCRGQTISDIVVLTQPPYAGGVLGRLAFVARTTRALHATTRSMVIRRFLLLQPGEPCDELRRAESERILRAQPYLVDARITAYDNNEGGVRIEVETRDEFSAIVGLGARASSPFVTVAKLGESNLMGAAVHVVGEWREGFFYRDEFAARFTHYQFLGRPYQLGLEGARRDIGGDWSAEASHPFLTDLQRVAWRVTGGGSRDYVSFLRPTEDANILGVDRQFADAGGIIRIGVPGRLSLFGASISMEREVTDAVPRIRTDTGLVTDEGEPLGFDPAERYTNQKVTRLNALWGVRNVRFMRVTGFDALTGTQDVRTGFQVGTLVGRGLNILRSRDDDMLVSADAYMGVGTPNSFAALQVQGEGRQDYDRNRWDGILASGRGAWYLRLTDHHRLLTSAEWSGGWRQRVPFQLTLGDREGGVRGFADSRAAGARRGVLRVEERWLLGRLFGLGDLGIATFVDAGKMMAGDVPYGVNTPVRAAAGVGLLAAVPPRSRRLWRVDLAFPVTKDPDARFELRVSGRDLTRNFWREPRDVRLGRERAVPSSIFVWP
jgi:hypothetical protein